jgi:hypothetical protein
MATYGRRAVMCTSTRCAEKGSVNGIGIFLVDAGIRLWQTIPLWRVSSDSSIPELYIT